MNPDFTKHGPSTLCIHAGTWHEEVTGGACSPVFPSTAFAFPNPKNQTIYPRYFNTPNQEVINRKLAALEGGERAVTFGSGMAAISTTLLSLLNPGDHAVFQADLYGGTVQLIRDELVRLGVHVSWCDNLEEIRSATTRDTRVIYVESPSNPLLRCLDLREIAEIGRQNGTITIVDNTFATPINQRPLSLGMDVVVHSATKYLNGHSDVNAGVVVSRTDLVERIHQTAVNLGGMLDANACSLLERGLKTLALRVAKHNENTLTIAKFLDEHFAVALVNYPGLESHVDHEVAKKQMSGYGGMLSFELWDADHVSTFLDRLQIIMPALSLGGVESLVCVPSRTSHRKLSPEERHRIGIGDGLIRLSVGIEDVSDLIADLRQAIECTATHSNKS